MRISTSGYCGHDLYLADTCFLSWVLLFQLRWHSSGQQQVQQQSLKLKKSFGANVTTLFCCCTRKVYQKAGFHHIASYLTSVRNHHRQIILLKRLSVACTKRGLHYNQCVAEAKKKLHTFYAIFFCYCLFPKSNLNDEMNNDINVSIINQLRAKAWTNILKGIYCV